MLTLAEFFAARDYSKPKLLSDPSARGTVLVPSHIWWTDLIALAVHHLGHNVLLMPPFYLFYQPENLPQFEHLFASVLQIIREHKVDLILGGNTTAILVDPKTKRLLHESAGVPLVNYWWDEPRTPPTFHELVSPAEYLAILRDPRVLNVFWDIDIFEEMAHFYGVTNALHAPLAATPELWPQRNIPLDKRPILANFLGNCHVSTDYLDAPSTDPLQTWAQSVVDRKLADLDRPMTACIAASPTPPSSFSLLPSVPPPLAASPRPRVAASASAPSTPSWPDFFRPWDALNTAYMHRTRNQIVRAAAGHLKDYFYLVGKGWDAMGLKAAKDHSGIPAAGDIYGQSRASLNLFGGCVHGGMPLRPYEIAASRGLILTHYNRELPNLYEPGKECLSFRTADEMIAHLDALLHTPTRFDPLVHAAHQRTLAQHTWKHRLQTVLAEAQERFDLPWGSL